MSTVLVVDDEFGIAELIDADILTDEGHRVADRRQRPAGA